MKGREVETFDFESRVSEKSLAKRLFLTVLFGLVILVSLLILITLFSENTEAEYGVQITVEPPNDQFMNASIVPQSAQFTVNITNSGTIVENVNVTVYFNDSSKPLAGWTVNPNKFSVNSLGPGVSVIRPVNVTAPIGEPAYSFAQLFVEGYPQENTSIYSSDSFIARVSPIWDAELIPHTDIFLREPGDIIKVTLQLTNSGTTTDTLTVEDITPAPYDTWGQVGSPTTVVLGAGNSTIMNYTITVDLDVTIGESPIKLYLGVRSQGASDKIIENVSITIVINQTFGVRISTTQNTKFGDPGETIIFKITIKNRGNDEDTFGLSHFGTSDLGMWEFSEVTLQLGESIVVNYTVEIDMDHDTSDILITLNATSLGDASALTYDTLNIMIHVNPRYEVNLGQTGGDIKDGLPGKTVQFNLTVKNEGTAIDTYELDYKAPSGFVVTFSNITIEVESVMVDPPNSIKVVHVWVHIREDPPVIVNQYTINITATSLSNGSVYDTYQFVVDVQQMHKAYLNIPSASSIVDPGETIEISGIITNMGNLDDEFIIIVGNLPPGWSYTVSMIDVLPPGDSDTVTIWIYTTPGTPPGMYPLNITVISNADPSQKFSFGFLAEINQIYVVDLPGSVSSKYADVGMIVTYSISIQNTGNGEDYVELRLIGSDVLLGNLYFSPTENGQTIHISIPGGGSETVYFNVTPPLDYWDTGSGDIHITIEAESLDDPNITPAFDSVLITTYVNHLYDFRVSGSGSQSGIPGETKVYSLTINNDASTSDSFNLRVSEISTATGGTISYWEDANPDPFGINPVSLAKGGQQNVDVYIDIPYPTDLSQVPPGNYFIEVEIKSSGDPSITKTVTFTMIVKQLYAAEIVNTVTSQDVDVGSYVTYTLQVMNSGNDVDNISITVVDDPTITGDQVPWTSVIYNSIEISEISLDAGDVAWIQFKVSIPERTDPGYPSTDPLSVTFPVTVSPSKPDEPGAMKEKVDITTNINPIYEFEVNPISKQYGDPGDNAEFSIWIKNTGTDSDTYTPELIWGGVNWEVYQGSPQFSPSSITLSPSQTGAITLYLTIPPDISVALAGEYTNNVTISSDANGELSRLFIIEVQEVYDLELTDPAPLSKSVDVGTSVSYQFKIKNTGNAQDTFQLDKIDLDTSSAGGGDQSSWAYFVLASNPSTPISYVILDVYQSKTIQLIIDIPSQSDPNFIELTNPLDMEIMVTSEGGTNLYDSFVTSTTVNPIYSFDLTCTTPGNTKEGDPGDSVVFTLQIRNSGTAIDTYNFRVTSVDESIFTVPNPNPIINLAVDGYGTTTASVSITTDLTKALAGIYQLEITVDSNSDPGISKNILLNVEITPLADVELTPSTQAGDGEPGDILDYSVQVRNMGNAQDTFELILNGTYKIWGEILDTNMNPISQITLTATGKPGYFTGIILRVTIPGANKTSAYQSYPITIKASSTNTENVFDVATVTTTVDEFVDLDLEYSGGGNPDKTFDPNKISTKFSFRVTNFGNADESAVEIRVDYLEASWDYTPKTLPDTLEPGKSTTIFIEFAIPSEESEGKYEMQVVVVSSNDPQEESDPITITISVVKPDLVISSGDIIGLNDTDELKRMIGNQVAITVRVHNEGSNTADSVQVKLYEGSSVKGNTTISSIDPDGYKDITFRWSVVAEEVELRVEAIPLEESNEDNNDVTIYLDLRPNLSFYGQQINFSKSNPKANETLIIRTFVKNSGGDAENVEIRFLWGDKIIGSRTADIGYNEVEEISIEWVVPDKPNETLSVKVEIDHPDSIGDGREATKSIYIAEKETGVEPPVPEPKGKDTQEVEYIWLIIGLVVGIVACILGFLFGRMGRKQPYLTELPPQRVMESEEQHTQGESEEIKYEDASHMPLPPPPPPATEQVNFEPIENK